MTSSPFSSRRTGSLARAEARGHVAGLGGDLLADHLRAVLAYRGWRSVVVGVASGFVPARWRGYLDDATAAGGDVAILQRLRRPVPEPRSRRRGRGTAPPPSCAVCRGWGRSSPYSLIVGKLSRVCRRLCGDADQGTERRTWGAGLAGRHGLLTVDRWST